MNLLLISVLGGIFVCDVVAFGQFIISRPIFCAPVTGLVLGDITTGLYVGLVMELIWITVIPLGSAVPPDSTVVAVSAAYLGSFAAGDRGYIVFLILLLIPVGILFKKLDIIHREFNSFFINKIEEKIDDGDFKSIDKSVYLSVFLFFLKGALFLLAVMWAGEKILLTGYYMLGDSLRTALNDAFYVIPSVGLGTVMTTFLFKKSQKKVLTK